MDKYYLAQIIASAGPSEWNLRKGYVVSDDGGGTVTITIGGSTESISGVRYLGTTPPSASAGCWLMVSGTDLFVLGQTS